MKSLYLKALLLLLIAPVHSHSVRQQTNSSPEVENISPSGNACIPETYKCLKNGRYSPSCCGDLECREVSDPEGQFQCFKKEKQLEKRVEWDEPKWTAGKEIKDEFSEFELRKIRRPHRKCIGYGDFCAHGKEELGCCANAGLECISIDGMSKYNTRCLPARLTPFTNSKGLETPKVFARSDVKKGTHSNKEIEPDVCIAHKKSCRGTSPRLSEQCCGYPRWQCLKETATTFVCKKPEYFSDTIAWPSGYTGNITPVKGPSVGNQVFTEDKVNNAEPKVVLDKHKKDAKIFRRYDILRKCHQAKDRCRFDDQCCINLECVREKPKDKYGRCKNIDDW